MIGILPCAGTASRLFNLPKFMLPTKFEQCPLIVYWINLLIKNGCTKVIIGVSEFTKIFIDNIIRYNLDEFTQSLISIKMVGNTITMNETILKCLQGEVYDLAIMGMPDTYISSLSSKLFNNLIETECDVGCYLWNIRKSQLGKIGQCSVNDDSIIDIIDKDSSCNYNFGWGVVVFKSKFESFIYSDDLHIGYSMQRYLESFKISYQIMNDGMYFDCGTVTGYREYLNYMEENKPIKIKGTVIIIAVYINNDDSCYNELIKCLTQLRNIYKTEIIITVDNCSLNNSWYAIAKSLNYKILCNDSKLHKFEMGAYKLALQHFRADKYIFIQGTLLFHNKLDLSILDTPLQKAICFDTTNVSSWYDNELKLINRMLAFIQMDCWNNDPLVLWNCFCCNDIFIQNMLDDGLFDLITNTKAHSCAFERVLGCYFKKICPEIICIDKKNYTKIWLNQDPVIYID